VCEREKERQRGRVTERVSERKSERERSENLPAYSVNVIVTYKKMKNEFFINYLNHVKMNEFIKDDLIPDGDEKLCQGPLLTLWLERYDLHVE